jgi:hypothetical protein
MTAELLTLGRAFKVLDVPTRRIAQLIYDRRVPYVMHDGIAHVPVETLDEYRTVLAEPA